MIRWVINALFLRCVGVCGTAVGVVAPVGDPGDWAVRTGGRFYGALCVAATGVAVGVDVVSSN